MSWANLEGIHFSDETLDILGKALGDIAKIYIKDVRRKSSVQEIETMLDMILGGNPESYLTDGEKISIEKVYIEYTNRISLHQLCLGDLIKARLRNGQWIYARVFEISEQAGVTIGVYDSKGIPEDRLNIDKLPFCLKAQNVSENSLDEQSEWDFIKSTELKEDDHWPLSPRRPSLTSLSGTLLCANYYYDLMDDKPSSYMKKNFT